VLLQLGADRAALARDRLSEALATARAQGARFWELRAALSLAQAGRSGPAQREQLALLCSGFTEGFDLPELQAARALASAARSRSEGTAAAPDLRVS
jgi:predicted ATPase